MRCQAATTHAAAVVAQAYNAFTRRHYAVLSSFALDYGSQTLTFKLPIRTTTALDEMTLSGSPCSSREWVEMG